MPELSWNSSYWSGGYDWKSGGEEWSEIWGGSEAQWFGSLYPRLHRLLPVRAILEIAPGFGRWTKFLLPACQDYLGVDLSAECVAACRKTFQDAQHARFIKNDGLSLVDVPEEQFDFVFTFDSLVHVEDEVMRAYVSQLLRKLTPNGVAFVHHSNLAALGRDSQNPHARARSVSADTVSAMVRQGGGSVLLQERINWGVADLTDCLTLFARQQYQGNAPFAHIDNPHFMNEAFLIRDTQAPWSLSTRRS